MKALMFLFIPLFLLFIAPEAYPDIVYLKNGRHIEGLIEKEDKDNVVLDVGFGTVKFRRVEIEEVYRSDKREVKDIKKEWKEQKKLEEKRWVEREKEREEESRSREFEPKKIPFSGAEESIVVNALLNKKVKASFLLDTGATAILLSDRIAKRLRINLGGPEKDKVKVRTADGRLLDAKFVVLDTVSVEGLEAKDVEAVVLLEDSDMPIGDGLLGMSFLKRFNFQIDTADKKLILKKRRE